MISLRPQSTLWRENSPSGKSFCTKRQSVASIALNQQVKVVPPPQPAHAFEVNGQASQQNYGSSAPRGGLLAILVHEAVEGVLVLEFCVYASAGVKRAMAAASAPGVFAICDGIFVAAADTHEKKACCQPALIVLMASAGQVLLCSAGSPARTLCLLQHAASTLGVSPQGTGSRRAKKPAI